MGPQRLGLAILLDPAMQQVCNNAYKRGQAACKEERYCFFYLNWNQQSGFCAPFSYFCLIVINLVLETFYFNMLYHLILKWFPSTHKCLHRLAPGYFADLGLKDIPLTIQYASPNSICWWRERQICTIMGTEHFLWQVQCCRIICPWTLRSAKIWVPSRLNWKHSCLESFRRSCYSMITPLRVNGLLTVD